ncbi:TetR/AcrR family transcriptional regulator [Nocardia alba]|uniref:TetR family transcriptional regulator n=1 Tax=Nocardia alba TaxID=225051 RepID=A0A4R1FUP9_9NOCA|nr:TetR/AcrR family transcriptional regulator [Nocardia alba]TCJ97409.1 TetR family transcriptional regulator [Nocardia alba]
MTVTRGEAGNAHFVTRADRGAARARRREVVIGAARDVFVDHGFHGASMEEISIRAQVSKPVLYNHFTGKVDLYSTVLQRYLDRMVGGIRDALRTTTGSENTVRRMVAAYFDFVDEDNGAGYTLVFDTPVPSEPSVEARVRRAMTECAALVGAELDAAGMDPYHARACAFGLVGASHLAARYWFDAGRPIPKIDAVDTTVALFWTGLSGIG